MDLALLNAFLGRRDDALRALGRAADNRDPRIALLRVSPEFEKLADEPGWNDLLTKLNLAE